MEDFMQSNCCTTATLQNEITWMLFFPPFLLVKAFVHIMSNVQFVKYHLEKLC